MRVLLRQDNLCSPEVQCGRMHLPQNFHICLLLPRFVLLSQFFPREEICQRIKRGAVERRAADMVSRDLSYEKSVGMENVT